MDVAIIGGGIAGLSLALNLHRHGIACRVFERAPEVKELGVGITLLPHAMREFAELGVDQKLFDAGIEIRESSFFNRFGQLIYSEPRGKFADYQYPEVSIHRGRLHMILYEAARERLGRDRVLTDHDCVGVTQDDGGVTISFKKFSTGSTRQPVQASAAIGCDGINSVIRKQFYPDDRVAFAGINTWRGVTRRKPILTGRTYMRIGSILTGKIVVYPIVDDVDRDGSQLINWMAEIKRDTFDQNDWNKPGTVGDFLPIYQDYRFDWLDVAELISTADQILEYPMVDKDPLDRWTAGPLDLRPRHARRRRGASDVSARLERSRPGRDRRAHARRLPRHRRQSAPGARRLRGRAPRSDRPRGANQPRASARLHQHQGRGIGGRQAVRESRRLHHPG